MKLSNQTGISIVELLASFALLFAIATMSQPSLKLLSRLTLKSAELIAVESNISRLQSMLDGYLEKAQLIHIENTNSIASNLTEFVKLPLMGNTSNKDTGDAISFVHVSPFGLKIISPNNFEVCDSAPDKISNRKASLTQTTEFLALSIDGLYPLQGSLIQLNDNLTKCPKGKLFQLKVTKSGARQNFASDWNASETTLYGLTTIFAVTEHFSVFKDTNGILRWYAHHKKINQPLLYNISSMKTLASNGLVTIEIRFNSKYTQTLERQLITADKKTEILTLLDLAI